MKKTAKNAKKPVTNVKRPVKGTINNKRGCSGGACKDGDCKPAKKRGRR